MRDKGEGETVEKLDGKSMDIVAQNIEKLKEIFRAKARKWVAENLSKVR
jgi:hypothetical protein